jgi:hypothetical protein
MLLAFLLFVEALAVLFVVVVFGSGLKAFRKGAYTRERAIWLRVVVSIVLLCQSLGLEIEILLLHALGQPLSPLGITIAACAGVCGFIIGLIALRRSSGRPALQ